MCHGRHGKNVTTSVINTVVIFFSITEFLWKISGYFLKTYENFPIFPLNIFTLTL
jgi:hypothetical protein